MVLFGLYMKAELEGVASVSLRKDADLCLTVKNPLSDYEVRDKVVVNPTAYVEQDESSRDDPHNFSMKWEGSKKASTLTVLSESEAKAALKKRIKKKSDEFIPRDYTDSGAFAPIMCVECRGLEPTVYFPGDEFVVTSEGGTIFAEDIDLSVGDWADYDAEHDIPVSMSEVEFKWEAV